MNRQIVELFYFYARLFASLSCILHREIFDGMGWLLTSYVADSREREDLCGKMQEVRRERLQKDPFSRQLSGLPAIFPSTSEIKFKGDSQNQYYTLSLVCCNGRNQQGWPKEPPPAACMQRKRRSRPPPPPPNLQLLTSNTTPPMLTMLRL